MGRSRLRARRGLRGGRRSSLPLDQAPRSSGASVATVRHGGRAGRAGGSRPSPCSPSGIRQEPDPAARSPPAARADPSEAPASRSQRPRCHRTYALGARRSGRGSGEPRAEARAPRRRGRRRGATRAPRRASGVVGGGAREEERRDAAHLAQLSRGELAERPGDRAREHDRRRLERLGRLDDRSDRGAGAEVADAPAVAPQQQPERHEREVVLLALDAREQRSRPLAAIPAAREATQPSSDEVAREVLLRDRDLAALASARRGRGGTAAGLPRARRRR